MLRPIFAFSALALTATAATAASDAVRRTLVIVYFPTWIDI